MQVFVDGLEGHLQDFWADVATSVWVGGGADGGLHERTPYWLNGIVPGSGLLQDPRMLNASRTYIEYIVSHANGTAGWLGPDDEILGGNAYWARFPLMLAIQAYAEYNESAAARVLDACIAHVRAAHTRMLQTPLGSSWSGARWMDFVLTTHWLLENYPGEQEQLLWDAGELAQQQGFDWSDWFLGPSFPQKSVDKNPNLFTHGVNNAQALKQASVWWRQSHNETLRNVSLASIDRVWRYHGTVLGTFTADEHLAGLMPSRGTELCTVVETMFSLNTIFSIQGAEALHLLDMTERAGYNAYPGEWTEDRWAHPYLEAVNEMQAVVSDPHVWVTDGPDSELYGLAPNYGCCTANGIQGQPKAMLFQALLALDGGITLAGYSPQAFTFPAQAMVRRSKGLPATATALRLAGVDLAANLVTVNITSSYPFSDDVQLTVTASAGALQVLQGAGVPLVLHMRVPGWAESPTIDVSDASTSSSSARGGGTPVQPGTLADVPLWKPSGGGPQHSSHDGEKGLLRGPVVVPSGEQSWSVTLRTNPVVKVERSFQEAATVTRGPIVYALSIGQHYEALHHYYMQSYDYAVHPTTPWNLALVLPNDTDPGAALRFVRTAPHPGPLPYSNSNHTMYIEAQGRLLPDWVTALNSAAAPPPSPVCGGQGPTGNLTAGGSLAAVGGQGGQLSSDCAPPTPIRLVPFGQTNLRIGEMPTSLD